MFGGYNIDMKKIFLSLLSPIILFSCTSSKTNNISHLPGTTYGKWEISDSEFYNKESEDYFVLIYSRYCVGCEYLSPYVKDYLDKIETNNLKKVYTFDVSDNEDLLFTQDQDQVINQVGNTNVYETLFYITPSMYEVKDNKLSRVIIDYNTIKDYLEGGAL